MYLQTLYVMEYVRDFEGQFRVYAIVGLCACCNEYLLGIDTRVSKCCETSKWKLLAGFFRSIEKL